MRNRVLLTPVLLAALLTGCEEVRSLQPLYTTADLADLPELAGDWHEEDGTAWTFTPGEDRSWRLKLKTKDETMEFTAHTVSLAGRFYLDLSEEDSRISSIPGHLYARLELQAGSLALFSLDEGWLKEQIRQHALPAERVPRGQKDTTVVVTASTEQWQGFLMRNALNPEAFEKPVRLGR